LKLAFSFAERVREAKEGFVRKEWENQRLEVSV
jgi:hypothetical protein